MALGCKRLRFSPWRGALVLHCALLAVLAAGCAPCFYACDRQHVSNDLAGRTEYALGPEAGCHEIVLPNGATLDDGLSEEEAVLIALWNNAQFQASLTDLGIAHGDLVQAGLLPNPDVIYFFPVPDKPFKYAFEFPLEALWLRPVRVSAAQREANRVCQQTTQLGLNLIRDVRQAYADVLLAEGRREVAQEAVDLRSRVAELAAARLEAGDASPQEAATARIDQLLAAQDLVRAEHDVEFAEHRLRNLLGIGDDSQQLRLVANEPPRAETAEAAALAGEAVATRPDILAAEESVAAAAERLRLAETSWFRLLGILDATSGRGTGHEFGPGFRATLPLFHTNDGLVLRSQSELERAVLQRQTLYDQIIMEVHQAHTRYRQALAEWEVLAGQVQPEAEAAIRRAGAAYREGDVPYVVVLETTRQLLDSRLRAAQLEADLRRSWAELERSVGRRLEQREILPEPDAIKEDRPEE
jgi:cobalt-zinc-cadmium efflux system outer membrane protein